MDVQLGVPETSLAAIARDDVASFYKTYYTPSNFILAVAGDFSHGRDASDFGSAIPQLGRQCCSGGKTGPAGFPSGETRASCR